MDSEYGGLDGRDSESGILPAQDAVPRAARKPLDLFCTICGEELGTAWRAQYPDARICEACDSEMGSG